MRMKRKSVFLLLTVAVACLAADGLPDIVLVGSDSPARERFVAGLRQSGFRVHVNPTRLQDATLLYAIIAADGPMPQTLEAIRRLDGQRLSRAAIVLVEPQDMDPELLSLVEREVREMLAQRIGPALSARVPVLKSDDPELVAKIVQLPSLRTP